MGFKVPQWQMTNHNIFPLSTGQEIHPRQEDVLRKGLPRERAQVVNRRLLGILPERGPDLAALVGVPLELARQAQVAQVVDPDPAVVRRHQDLLRKVLIGCVNKVSVFIELVRVSLLSKLGCDFLCEVNFLTEP